MKKYPLPLVLVAFAAFFAILSACGDGEPIDYVNKESDVFKDMDAVREELISRICSETGTGCPSSSSVSNAVCPQDKELKCSMSASFAYVGTAVRPLPVVTCGDENVSSETVWSPEGLIFTEPGNDFVVARIGPRTTLCGSILITPPPSSSSGGGSSSSGDGSSSSGGESSSSEEWQPSLPGLDCQISAGPKYKDMPFATHVTCNDTEIPGSAITWAPAEIFTWTNNGLVPQTTGTNISISASINSPCINSLTHQPESFADCGTVNVEEGKLRCIGLVQTGYKDQVIDTPDVICDGVSASSVEWLWNGSLRLYLFKGFS